LWVIKTNIAFLESRWLDSCAVRLWTSSKLFEFHDVAGERARLVGEDVLDLAELLVNVGALRAAEEVLLIVEHICVVLHEGALEKLDHLESHEQGDRHKVAKN